MRHGGAALWGFAWSLIDGRHMATDTRTITWKCHPSMTALAHAPSSANTLTEKRSMFAKNNRRWFLRLGELLVAGTGPC
jgi:hypothetical protein